MLRVLYATDGLRQCDIAATLSKDKAAICRCITGMVKKGLVVTQSVSYKCQCVFLTDRAIALKSQIMGVANECDSRLQNLLTTQESESLRKILIKIIENK